MKEKPIELLHWLAETKFHPPLLRDDVISRYQLVEEVRARVVTYPLTLISAPAGYGKTTLLASLPPIASNVSAAWLSLDEGDNDPTRFLAALVVSLQHLNPEFGAAVQSLLTNQTQLGADVRRVTSVLINDVLENFSDPFVLILDDLHRISEPVIFAALDYLLEHLPLKMHLLVAARVDPPLALARLRARGEMVELRLGELRFSDEETNLFLNGHLQLDLSGAELALLQSLAEGWPVGLRLLASSLDHIGSAEERRLFIHHLSHSDRNIFDFLAEEVFNRQEPEIRAFLLETAILPELTPKLCRAVTGQANAGAMLEEVYRRNLFLVQVSPLEKKSGLEPHVSRPGRSKIHSSPPKIEARYRYHELFAEFLGQKLEQEWPGRVPGLNLRAARVESDPARAVAHYLAAAKWSEAADLIEGIGAEVFNQGYLDTLSRWINALPSAVRERRPRLLHYLSHYAFLKGAWEDVQSLLERALEGFETAGDQAGQGEVLADLAICASGLGDLTNSAALYGAALTYPIPLHTRVQALLGRALARGALGDWKQVEKDFNAAMNLIQGSSELDPLLLVMFPFFHPSFAFLPGALDQLERICRLARVQVGMEASPSHLMVMEMTTVLHLFRGQLKEAIGSGEQALALRKRLGGHPYLSLDAALFLMLAHAAKGNFAAVEPLFDLLFLGVDQENQPPPDLPIYLFYAGRVRWLQGRMTEARKIYAQMCALLEENPIADALEVRICRIWMESLLVTAEGRYDEAERALRQPEILEQKDRGSTMHGSTRLMLARLYWQQGRHQEALLELAPVLAYHEQLGIPFTILLEGQSIVPLLRLAVEEGVHEGYAACLLAMLAADDEMGPVDVPYTGETLTPREVEVLGLVAAGSSNRAIAEELVISEWTVKSHLTNVYRKLDVASRAQAILRARDLGLG